MSLEAKIAQRLAASLGVAVWGFGPACLYDASERCGPNQRLVSHDRCVCVEGTFFYENECVDCGPNAALVEGVCGCLPGFEASPDSGLCEPSLTNLGEACSADADCSAPYPICHEATAGAGYCTRAGCSASADCEHGYLCRLRAAEPFCERPPAGQGTPCTEAADCAGLDADYCESVISQQCLVSGCGADDECSGDWVCCDFARVGYPITLCVPGDACITR